MTSTGRPAILATFVQRTTLCQTATRATAMSEITSGTAATFGPAGWAIADSSTAATGFSNWEGEDEWNSFVDWGLPQVLR